GEGLERRFLDEAAHALADVPGLGYAARYEQARYLYSAGDKDQARELFRSLYAQARQQGMLPPIDLAFRQALEVEGHEAWAQLIRQTADEALTHHRYLAVIALAGQCAEVDDQPLADDLLATVLGRIAGDTQRLPVTIAAVEYLWSTHQLERADRLVQPLLGESTF